MNTQLISSELNTASSFHICIFHFQNKRERKRERNCSAFLIRQTNGTHIQTETWLKTNTEAVSWWHGPSITRSHSKSKGTSFLRHLSHAVTMSLVFFFLFFSLSLPPSLWTTHTRLNTCSRQEDLPYCKSNFATAHVFFSSRNQLSTGFALSFNYYY